MHEWAEYSDARHLEMQMDQVLEQLDIGKERTRQKELAVAHMGTF